MQLFPKVTSPYYVAAPSWTHKSSGVRVLHLLVHALNESGQKAYLIPFDNGNFCRNPHLNTPLLDSNYEQFYNYLEIEPIIIYPEIVRGNPYNGKKVVRYLLAEPPEDSKKRFLPSDRIYNYRSDMGSPFLCIPTFDSSVFYPPFAVVPSGDGVTARLHQRSGTCFYSCKYEALGNKLLPVTENSIRLEGSPNRIADILRNSEKMYVYEHSEISVLARMCGCPVEEIVTPYWKGTDDDWHFAKGDIGTWIWDLDIQLQDFIQDTQEWK